MSAGPVIAHVSRSMRLEAGDLIFTGTPPGVAAIRSAITTRQAGDLS